MNETSPNRAERHKMSQKLYPFSTQKHAHDIEFYRNRIYNTFHDAESGLITVKNIDELYDLYDELTETLSAVMSSRDGRIAWLTGNQIAIAKKAVMWATEQRSNR